MQEGKVYVCRWEQLPSGEYIGVVARPKLRIVAKTIADITDQLTDAIAVANGDCEAQIEFEPPIFEGVNPSWFQNGHVWLGAPSDFRYNADAVFEGGFCDRCRCPIGPRTSDTLIVEGMWPGDLANSFKLGVAGFHVFIASPRFLDLLSDEDRRSFDLRPTVTPPRSRKKFWEIVPRVFVPEVRVKGLEQSGWHCARCSRTVASNAKAFGYGSHVVRREDLPATSLFFVGTSTYYHFCIKGDRWEQLKAACRKASISSLPLAVVSGDDVTDEILVPEIEINRQNLGRE